MNQATKYWVERIKRLTTALGRYKKNTAKLNRILKKMEKDSPQYMEYENELLELEKKYYSKEINDKEFNNLWNKLVEKILNEK